MAASTSQHRYRIRYACGVPLPRVTDGRSAEARLFRLLVEGYARELSGPPSDSQKETILQLATIGVRQARQRQDVIEGRDIADDAITRLTSERRRLEDALNARASKDKPPPPSNLKELLDREERGA